MLYIREHDIVFQEVPGEISLALTVSGCPLRCPGCHRPDTWRPRQGVALNSHQLNQWLDRYQGLISCVLFMGGDWQEDDLICALRQIRQRGLRTCLYSGYSGVCENIYLELTYLKTGAWIAERGGLDSPTTNQRFIDCATGKTLNHLFRRPHAQTQPGSDSGQTHFYRPLQPSR